MYTSSDNILIRPYSTNDKNNCPEKLPDISLLMDDKNVIMDDYQNLNNIFDISKEKIKEIDQTKNISKTKRKKI